ncbi:hypothetical protein EI94DRAFT_1732862 [Lactarius quietus]|nr:hypothetical protein EI94DRAFT_1732862 [Lactarius quietus]
MEAHGLLMGITLPGAVVLEGTFPIPITPRRPVIYTTTSWWGECTGNSAVFGSISPPWIASWGSSIGTLHAGWSYTTFWQYADSGTFPGDQGSFNGDDAGLSHMALGS